MFSQLSKGYGSWTAGYVDPYFGEKKERECTLPEIDQDSHFHGVTIGTRSGRSTAMSWAPSTKRSREPTIDGIPLPKTYTTRKGALQLFVGPDDLEADDDEEDNDDNDDESYPLKPKYVQVKRAHGQELIDLSLKLGTMERLAMSVLQFGDEDYDHEHTSVTDTKNKSFLKFLHSVDEARAKGDIDSHVQPGGDLKKYLKDLKSSAGSRFSNMYVSKSRESLELQAILRGLDNSSWPLSYSQDGPSEKSGTGQFTRPVSRVSSRGPSPGPPSTPRSNYQVLSAKKVAASIKSGSYLGRPSSRISAVDDDMSEQEQGGAGHITPASVMGPTWTPTDSTDDFLIDTRDKFWEDDGESSEDGRKRRRFKERSFLTNNSQLYQGRNARKGEGQRAMEVKVTCKGDGDSSSQKMSQIAEESESKKNAKEENSEKDSVPDDNRDADSWAVKVSRVKHVPEEDGEEKKREQTSPGVIDMELGDEKDVANSNDRVAVKINIRPDSGRSNISSTSSVSARTASTRAMSIVTLQSMNKPRAKQPNIVDKHSLSNRRGTYAYDPNKGLIQTGKERRQSDPFNGIRARSNSSHSIEQSKSQNTRRESVGDSKSASQRSDDTDGRFVQRLVDSSNQNIEPDLDVEPTKETLDADNVEPQQADLEDYLLDNIDECNEEIQQIEAQAEATDGESDSDSCMDEEVIKVILEGQNNNEIMDEDLHDYQSVNVDDLLEEQQPEEMERDGSKSRSEVNQSEDIGQVETEDILGNTGDEFEDVTVGEVEQTVDEIYDENVSEVRSTKSAKSTKSARKSISKRSKSILESEDGGTGTGTGTGGEEYRLPVLDSDRLEEKDGINSEDNQTIQTVNDEQTGFSGSTASYSDILATDRLSEPEYVSQSRNSNSQKLSRPSSVTSSKTASQVNPNDTEDTGTGNKHVLDETADGNDKGDSNIDENEPNQNKVEAVSCDDVESEVTAGTQNVEVVSESLEQENTGGDEVNNETETVSTIPLVVQKPEENVEKYGDNEVIDAGKLEPLKTIEEVGGSDKMDEVNDGVKSAELEIPKISSTITVPTAVPEESDTKTEPISITTEPTKVVEKKSEAPKLTKGVPNKSDNKQTVPKAAMKTEPKLDKTSKPTKPEIKTTAPKPAPKPEPKPATVTENKNGNKTKNVGLSSEKSKTNVSSKDRSVKKGDSEKPKVESAVLEGEGLLSVDSELASRLDDGHGEGLNIEADITDSAGTGEKDAHAIAAELDALGLNKKTKKGSKVYPLLPPGSRPKAAPEKQKIPDHLQDALNRRASESRDYLEQDLERRGFLKDGKVTAMVGETLSGPTLEAVGEGLTEEELEIAKQILQQKLDDAKDQLEGKPSTGKSKTKKPVGKGGKKTGGKKKNDPSDDKTKEEMDRDAIRAKRDHEQQLREQEAADLQRKIAENKRLLQQQADQTSAKSKELLDEMERLEREAADMQRAEDEARQILADERKKQREERDTRRKADLERKKQEAMDRRERERKEIEEKRRKESEMMEKIADAEMRRRMREEEERRIDEEERLAQERYEEEMREAQRIEEEEEERLKEMERQAEEEAMQRLIEEREAAERERRRIREEEEAFREAEQLRMERMAADHRKLEDERRRLQDIEDAKREAERQNLLKLRQLEEEARSKIQEEIEKRRSDALARRDFNLESKQNVDKLRHYQGLTRAWTFSYFVHWPRETYESRLRPKLQKGKRPFGAGDPRKNVKINNPPPKKAEDTPAAAGGEDVPPPAVP